DDRGGVPVAAARRGRRLSGIGRMAGQGGRLRGPGTRRCLRHRAARLAHQRHRLAAGRGAGRPAGAASAARLSAGRVRRADAAMTRADQIAANLAEVRARIAAAARAAGRAPESVRLLAVSKKMPADDVRAAIAAGQRAFGENYAQELRDKSALLAPEATPPEWHFIGPLQTNKVKYVAGKVALLHTVGSSALLDAIEARGAAQACLVQVNVAGEASKSGLTPADLPALLDRFAAMKHARCEGLMLIPPRGDAR